MRIPIRVQLGSLILIASLIGLAVISIAVWVTTYDFVLEQRASRLSLVASLKVAQLQANLDVMRTSTSFVSSRVLIQNALMRYNNDGNNTVQNWQTAVTDLQSAIGGAGSIGQALLVQAKVFGKDDTGVGGSGGLMNVTSSIGAQTPLPYYFPNGTQVFLGADDVYGYPQPLYPNLTFPSPGQALYQDRLIGTEDVLLLGPWSATDNTSLLSMTQAIVNNTNAGDILGWLTTVMSAELIQNVQYSGDGLDDTGQTLILGPSAQSNTFPRDITQNADQKPEYEVRLVLLLNSTYQERHPDHAGPDENSTTFNAKEYPTIYDALNAAAQDNATSSGANLRARNEAGEKVSVGYAMTSDSIVQWIVLVEQSRPEVWQPINRLRDVILACLFATIGFMAVLAFPLAHFASLPILRLRQATARSVDPPDSASRSSLDSFGSFRGGQDGNEDDPDEEAIARKEGLRNPLKAWKRRREEKERKRDERRKRAFKIPGKVKERKNWIKDELSDLTTTFNEMSDELMLQYSKLEQRVQQRTAELELSKKAAEAANESKTLFIANISHELKTPLNGILGMCAVCMQEDDPIRLKRSLGIIYKSGDLLLNLLTDLLTFSKNQVGQSLTLDEKDFRLRDISSQILAIFDKQAKEGQIALRVEYEGVSNMTNDSCSPERREQGPLGTGSMKDMILWGDIHRILQVVINLVSNSLKFTPHGGSVGLTVRCLSEIPDLGNSRKTSMNSRISSRQHSSRLRSSDASISVARMSTANAINVKDKPHALAYVSERTASPPPGKYLYFEFEVRDTGPGIPENLQAKIFEPFVQGDLRLSKKFGGTGLGLAICSQLANLMRGSMRVDSAVGVGSTFTLKIPLRMVRSRADSSASSAVDRSDGLSRGSSIDDGERAAASHGPIEYHEDAGIHPNEGPPSPPPPAKSNDSQPRLVGLSQPFFATSEPMESPGSQPAAMQKIAAEVSRAGRIRVLVAEDNKVNQEVVLRMLKLEDIYDVTVAKDGQEALDLVKESMHNGSSPFNLIFMDVQMPNVDGLTSTKMIREIGYRAPIVALTAFAEESNIKDCLDSGMNYFLSKPIRRPQLKKVLKEYCPPIAEENEEGTAPPLPAPSAREEGMTIVVNGQSVLATTTPLAAATADLAQQDSRPVSPRSVP